MTEFTDNNTTHSEDEFTASETVEGADKPKSSNKVIIVVALLAVVAVVGFYGMKILNQSPAPAAPVAEQPAAPDANGTPAQEDPLEALGADPASADQLAPVNPDLGVDPLENQVDPLASQPDVVTDQGLGGDPLSPVGQVDPVSPDAIAVEAVDPGVIPADQVIDPSLEALMNQQPAQPTTDTQVIEPEQVQPVSPPVVEAVPAESVSFDGSNLASVVGQAVTDALRPMEERWNSRFDSLERRVSRIEQAPKPAAKPASKPKAASRPRPAAKPSTPSKPRATAKPAPPNRIEVLDQPTPAPVARPVVTVPPRAAEPTAPAATSCSLGAVLEGRAWVKRGDGSFDSYIVGDTLPDGKVISAISPERGIVAGGKTWSCN